MKAALLVVACAAAVRLLLAALVPLVPDEAYYWEWSRHLAAGYFDHPPAIAWVVRAGTAIAGDSPLGVRLGVIVLGFAGCVAAVALAHRLAGPRGAMRAAVLMSVLPLAGIGLVLATPDVPLLVFMAAALWALDHAIADSSVLPPSPPAVPAGSGGAALAWWGIVGLAVGASLLSKYTAVLVPTAVAIACAISPPLRRQFARPGPYLACAIAALMFLPVVRWNADHQWLSFAFQLRHGLGPPRGSALSRELELLGAQLGLATPILLPLVAVAVIDAVRRPQESRPFVLACVATFIWGFFALSATRRPVLPNWPAMALLPGVILLASRVPGRIQSRWEWAGAVLAAAIVIVASIHAVHPWLPLQPRRDPIAQAYGWDELARAVVADDQRVDPPGERVWVAADRYQEAAELAWQLPGHPTVFSLELASRHNEFDLWPTAADSVQLGQAMTVVLDDTPDQPVPVQRLGPSFARVVRGALVEMHWGATRVVARRRVWHFLELTVPLSVTLGRAPT
jgi:4-amino-4-deoxy-L-arabinose transferase-like glycosyltransferase